jgi:hypothetical protein
MSERLKNCWELRGCGRERGGSKVGELGECIASRQQMGHSCWAIAGTLCGGEVQGTFAASEGTCMLCPVLRSYHRITGTEAKRVVQEFPEEQQRYSDLLMRRMKGNRTATPTTPPRRAVA